MLAPFLDRWAKIPGSAPTALMRRWPSTTVAGFSRLSGAARDVVESGDPVHPAACHAAAQRRVSRARCGESAERREAKDEAARAEQSRAGAPSCTGTARCLCRQLRGTRRLPGLRATAGDTAKVSVDIALAAAATRLRGRPGRPRKAEVRDVSHENCPPTPLE